MSVFIGSKNYRKPQKSKKTTTFVFNKRSVTYLRKYPITQYIVSDSGHSTKGLKRGGTTRICKTMKYNGLHLSPHSMYLSKQRLYRLKWIVANNQWCKYADIGKFILTVDMRPIGEWFREQFEKLRQSIRQPVIPQRKGKGREWNCKSHLFHWGRQINPLQDKWLSQLSFAFGLEVSLSKTY